MPYVMPTKQFTSRVGDGESLRVGTQRCTLGKLVLEYGNVCNFI